MPKTSPSEASSSPIKSRRNLSSQKTKISGSSRRSVGRTGKATTSFSAIKNKETERKSHSPVRVTSGKNPDLLPPSRRRRRMMGDAEPCDSLPNLQTITYIFERGKTVTRAETQEGETTDGQGLTSIHRRSSSERQKSSHDEALSPFLSRRLRS